MPALCMLLHKLLKWEAVAALQSPGTVWVTALAAGGRQSQLRSPGSGSVAESAGNRTSLSLIRLHG